MDVPKLKHEKFIVIKHEKLGINSVKGQRKIIILDRKKLLTFLFDIPAGTVVLELVSTHYCISTAAVSSLTPLCLNHQGSCQLSLTLYVDDQVQQKIPLPETANESHSPVY